MVDPEDDDPWRFVVYNGYATNGAAPGMVERNGHGRLGPARNGCGGDIFEIAGHIVANHLALLQKKDMRELTRSCGRTAEQVQAAVDFIRTLDPRRSEEHTSELQSL